MDEKEFKKLVKKDKYQVFLLSTQLTIPFIFAVHIWLVTNNKGLIKRWDVWHSKNLVKTGYGYVYYNLFNNPVMGINKYPSLLSQGLGSRWESKLIGFAEGSENSIANKMIKFVEKQVRNYPYKDEYHYWPGPNSNTFIQWVINHFPESKFKLPWNAFGKGYRI